MAEFGWYSERVLEHYQNPRNVGKIEDADGVGVVGNPVCGDMMMITIKVRDDRIEDVKFKTFGCGAAIATTSMVTELVKGKTLDEALQITNRDVAEALDGLPPIKMHCSVLAEQGIAAAIKDYYDRHPQRELPPEVEDKLKRLEGTDPHAVPNYIESEALE